MKGLEDILGRLIQRQNLSRDEVKAATELIANGNADPCQISAFLALLAAKGETSEEISAMAEVMRGHSTTIPLSSSSNVSNVVDIVGTGGDGFNTVNISTAASILTSACGVAVAKHGSTSVSSLSGSSDVLIELTRQSENHSHIQNPLKLVEMLENEGYCFIYAPFFHPAMKHVVPIRKALKIRTVFNILGPLLNPLMASSVLNKAKKVRFGMVLGVYSPHLLKIYAEVIQKLGVDHALVVHGSGMDELNTCGVVQGYEVRKNEEIRRFDVDPVELGLPLCTVDELKGGSAKENADIIKQVFTDKNKRSDEGKFDRLRETIALNSAAALYVSGKVGSLKEGLDIAMETLQSGKALEKLEQISNAWNS